MMYRNIGGGFATKFFLEETQSLFDPSTTHIVFIAEPWIRREELHFVLMEGWTLFSSLHSELSFATQGYGGLLMYVHDRALSMVEVIDQYDGLNVDQILFYIFLGYCATYSDTLCVIGDLNAALGCLDLETGERWPLDSRGATLKEVFRQRDMQVVNFTDFLNTGATFMRGTGVASVLDYVVCERELYQQGIVNMRLETFTSISDHAGLYLTFTIPGTAWLAALPDKDLLPLLDGDTAAGPQVPGFEDARLQGAMMNLMNEHRENTTRYQEANTNGSPPALLGRCHGG
ncbi:hypothetical protein DFH27DRAFT_610896 [Peziza echinospora]|nr:hypothetical protein DFH27DRAFT_610896 [Peziza echinospora]